ncbi:MAG: MerR family transcriptional regulator [Gemmatimonadetes bacterium]|nr:MerR family transcriptional regulator [Gemmatimonadota bacterium]
MTDRIRIGELAEEAGVSRDTIRFYERAGLLPKPRRTATRHRVYDHDVALQIRFIRRAQDLGLTLDDIRQLIELRESAGEGVPRGVAEILRARLQTVETRISNDEAYRERLALAIQRAESAEGQSFFAELGADGDHNLKEA